MVYIHKILLSLGKRVSFPICNLITSQNIAILLYKEEDNYGLVSKYSC